MRCKSCGIFFITYPQNKGRKDLNCPFGCQEAHRKQQSKTRSTEYYRTKEGQEKKRQQNAKRSKKSQEVVVTPDEIKEQLEFCAVLLRYIRALVSLIDGLSLSIQETISMLKQVLRQRGIAQSRKLDHIVFRLHEVDDDSS